jgi:hypothetical protein
MIRSNSRHRLCFLILVLALARQTPAEEMLAFPSAEGFGRLAKGGRGGRVIEVTNLDRQGPGSLRAALEAKGSRTVVFRVAGTVDMAGATITVSNPYLTVAGQTAPGDGILVKRCQAIVVATHDVVVRHVRVRPGPDVPVPYSGMALTVGDPNGRNKVHDVIVDHCSFSWATDDTAASWGAINVTFQWSIFSEGLNVKTKFQGNDVSLYGKGFVTGFRAKGTSFVDDQPRQ